MERRHFLSGSVLGTASLLLSESLSHKAQAASQPGVNTGVVPSALELELPVIMGYTVLPSGVTARAWTNMAYREALLSDPDAVLRATPMKTMPWPNTISFKVHEENSGLRHFPLPVFKTYFSEMSDAELMARLRHETYCETALEFFLPVDVIWRAWTDEGYRSRLLRDGNAALAELGYASAQRVVVHENQAAVYHLALKAAPHDIGVLSIAEARARYISMMERASSSQCCASGTHDEVPTRG